MLVCSRSPVFPSPRMATRTGPANKRHPPRSKTKPDPASRTPTSSAFQRNPPSARPPFKGPLRAPRHVTISRVVVLPSSVLARASSRTVDQIMKTYRQVANVRVVLEENQPLPFQTRTAALPPWSAPVRHRGTLMYKERQLQVLEDARHASFPTKSQAL